MSQELITNRPSVADRVRQKRAAERKEQVEGAEPITINAVTSTTTQHRARLNFMPDDSALANLVGQALSALSKGIRWARGSIVNLIV